MANKIASDLLKSGNFKLKEALFIEAFARTGNKTASAKTAGVSYPTVEKWLKREEISEAIVRAQVLLANAQMDSDFIMGRVNLVARACLADYFDEAGEFVGFDNLTQEQKLCMKKFKKSRDKFGLTVHEIELYDAIHCSELIGKPLSLFDKEIDSDFSIYSDKELDEMIDDLNKKLNKK
jgi:hypothetical protein